MLYDATENFSNDIALSFPGELRVLANALSDYLTNKHSLRVFCETDTTGKNKKTIVSSYAQQAVLIVPFFMKQYGYSDFCQKEWHSIRENWDILHDRVFPVRFDETCPGYGISDYISFPASNSDLATIADEISKKFHLVKQQWCVDKPQLQVAPIGENVGQIEKVCGAVRAHSPGIGCTETTRPMASDKEGKDAWINDLIDMFSDLVLVVCPASPVLVRRESNRREALNITKKRAKNFKRTLLLIDEKDKKFFEQLPNQPGIKVCVVPKPSKLPSEAAEYISVLAGSAVCNVFFDDSFVPEIESLRRELFAVYPNKADAVRWFDLSTLGGSSLTHCAMLTCAGQPPPLRENIYLISEAFMSLASDKEGDPQQSSIAALFPRLVAYRTDERAKQSFMFVKDSAGRILNDKQQRDKLTNYWRYAEPLLYTNTADLKTRIESMFFNFND